MLKVRRGAARCSTSLGVTAGGRAAPAAESTWNAVLGAGVSAVCCVTRRKGLEQLGSVFHRIVECLGWKGPLRSPGSNPAAVGGDNST